MQRLREMLAHGGVATLVRRNEDNAFRVSLRDRSERHLRLNKEEDVALVIPCKIGIDLDFTKSGLKAARVLWPKRESDEREANEQHPTYLARSRWWI